MNTRPPPRSPSTSETCSGLLCSVLRGGDRTVGCHRSPIPFPVRVVTQCLEVLRRGADPFTETAADSPYDGQRGTLAAYGFCPL